MFYAVIEQWYDAFTATRNAKEIEMKGTEKQVQYAKAIIDGAKVWHTTKAPSRAQLAAIEVIEAVERGDIEAAEAAMEHAAGWVEMAIDLSGDSPAINAAAVIDALKGAYSCAKDNCLI